MGHNAASTRHAHEQKLLWEAISINKHQSVLAERVQNPNLQDICRLYDKYRLENYGKDDGKDHFEKLQEAVDLYNQQHGDEGGKAILQWYSAGESTEQSDKEDDELKPPKKKRKKDAYKSGSRPLILAICTPIMSRAHQHVQQSSDITFCD